MRQTFNILIIRLQCPKTSYPKYYRPKILAVVMLWLGIQYPIDSDTVATKDVGGNKKCRYTSIEGRPYNQKRWGMYPMCHPGFYVHGCHYLLNIIIAYCYQSFLFPVVCFP